MQEEIYRECRVGGLFRITSLYTFFLRRFAAGYRFRGESHDFYEAVLVLAGKVGITAEKSIYELQGGQMILHPPGEFHNIWSIGEEAPEVLVFSFRATSVPLLPAPRIFRVTLSGIEKARALNASADHILCKEGIHVRGVQAGKEGEAAAFLHRLELFLLSVFNGGTSVLHPDMRSENYCRILEAMEANIAGALSLSSLAALCHLSAPAVEKTVKNYSGFGAMHYFNTIKMRKAGELLCRGASVKETAFAVGFSDPNYFSARFRKWAGVPPSRYGRKQEPLP